MFIPGVDCGYRFMNGKTWVQVDGYKNAQLSDCLNTIVDPEQKRQIIGDVFMHVIIVPGLAWQNIIISRNGSINPPYFR